MQGKLVDGCIWGWVGSVDCCCWVRLSLASQSQTAMSMCTTTFAWGIQEHPKALWKIGKFLKTWTQHNVKLDLFPLKCSLINKVGGVHSGQCAGFIYTLKMTTVHISDHTSSVYISIVVVHWSDLLLWNPLPEGYATPELHVTHSSFHFPKPLLSNGGVHTEQVARTTNHTRAHMHT